MLGTITSLLVLHFVFDFILQTNWMASNKSRSIKALTVHISVYTLGFVVFGWEFALLNGLLHWITDFISSKLSFKAWHNEKRHLFFVILGADQLVHTLCLLYTAQLLGVL